MERHRGDSRLEVCRVLIEAEIPEHPPQITPQIEQEYWAAGERGDMGRCREIIEVYGMRWQCRYKIERCAGCPERHSGPAE